MHKKVCLDPTFVPDPLATCRRDRQCMRNNVYKEKCCRGTCQEFCEPYLSCFSNADCIGQGGETTKEVHCCEGLCALFPCPEVKRCSNQDECSGNEFTRFCCIHPWEDAGDCVESEVECFNEFDEIMGF